ncbi:DNA repair protein RadA [bacterium]|nr:DNA repair protein RadA [bacterium]
MAGKKQKALYVCQSCGYESARWLGRCPDCNNWNTFQEEMRIGKSGAKHSGSISVSSPIPLSQIKSQQELRHTLGIEELDRVLGGGLVPGAVYLVGGAPGMGKSTLLMQACSHVAKNGKKILYISGEESIGQIKLRAERLDAVSDNFYLAAATNVEAIAQMIQDERPVLAVVDSIQTVFSENMESLPGNVSQVKHCGHLLTRTAKEHGIPLFIVGHVTKDGTIAGPRVLEHLVDGLLLLEGDGQHIYRLLRAVKNRFGSTNEIGLFEMTDKGINQVLNPSQHLIEQRREDIPGTIITVSMEGTRPLLIEAQALVTPANYGVPQRTATGFNPKRLSLLLAVLEKRLRLKFGTQDVFVNAAGGLSLSEPASDLAVVTALISSIKDIAPNNKTVVFGEVGLTGEIRGISHAEMRIREAERLGFKYAILPAANCKKIESSKMKLIAVNNVKEIMNSLFNK